LVGGEGQDLVRVELPCDVSFRFKGFEWTNYSSPYVVVVVMRMVAVSREVQSGEAAERICSDWKGCLSFSPVVDVRGELLLMVEFTH
jgi:hypothetical protein